MKIKAKILVIDDDEDDFFIIKEYISQIKDNQFEVSWCSVYKEAVGQICNREFDLYLVDYLLGANTGLDLIKEVGASDCEAPIVLLTGNGNYAIDKEAMQYGAVDYLIKSELNTEKIERCIRYSLERAASTKALRDKERKFRNIFERSKDVVFISGGNLDFHEVNEAAVQLFGYAKDEITSRSLYDFLASEEDVAFVQQELGSKGFVFDKPADFRTKESGIRQCVITVSKELDVKGEEYCQGIIHDITVLKKAEKASLALEKLKMAGRLLRAMAHEVRNPLSNIMLSVEQIRETSQETERGLFMNIIERNCLRINELISDLLNSSGGGELQIQKHALQSVLDETLEAAKDRINLQNIAVKKNYLDEEAWVMVDREKLKIAFLNIIINAIESMQKDKGQLLLSVEKKDDLTYAVIVGDNGCGIDNDNLIKLFEPYFTTKSNGIGLGLSSTLNILQSHNAAVDVESVLAKGTAFKISFTIA